MTPAPREFRDPISPLERWDPRWKLAALTLASAVFAVVSEPAVTAAAFGLGLIGTRLGRVRPREVAGRLLPVLTGMLPVLAVFPFTNDNGLSLALSMTLRALAIACVGLILLRTSPLAETLAAAHRLRVPAALVQIALLTHRYASLLFEEGRRVRLALRTRAFRAGTDLHTYRTTGHALGTLLLRGGDRAERVADAMRTRGFDGEFRTARRFRATAGDAAGFAAVALLLAGLLLAEWRP